MDIPLRHTLSKEERLSSRKDIAELLAEGRFGTLPGGFRYCVRRHTGSGKNRILVSVPKKFFKRAVRRNLLKRRIREAYRLQKHLLPVEDGTDIMFVYGSRETLCSARIRELVAKVLEIASAKAVETASAKETVSAKETAE